MKCVGRKNEKKGGGSAEKPSNSEKCRGREREVN